MKDISAMPKKEILTAIDKARNILIVSHSRPDGDCLGAAFAMRRYCMHLGKIADIANDSPLPRAYEFFEGAEHYNKQNAEKYDLAIVVDCATDTRYSISEQYVKAAKCVIWIDHHMKDFGYGTINWVDEKASSTCEMIYRLLSCVYMDKEIADYLFIGLSTDTGHFMHNNVNIGVLETAVELVRHGADCSKLSASLYKNRTIEKTRLIAKAIDNLRFFEDGKICIVPLTSELLGLCNISSNDTEGIIDYASAVIGVKVAVCMSEERPNVYKVSFRSRSENVAAVAETFGGGGHKYASGCQICGHIEDVIQKIIRAVRLTLWTE